MLNSKYKCLAVICMMPPKPRRRHWPTRPKHLPVLPVNPKQGSNVQACGEFEVRHQDASRLLETEVPRPCLCTTLGCNRLCANYKNDSHVNHCLYITVSVKVILLWELAAAGSQQNMECALDIQAWDWGTDPRDWYVAYFGWGKTKVRHWDTSRPRPCAHCTVMSRILKLEPWECCT